MNTVSAQQLLASLSPSDHVFIAGSAGEPAPVVQALIDDPQLAAGAHFLCSFVPGVNKANLCEDSTRRMSVFFMQPRYRDALHQDQLHFYPSPYSAIHHQLSQPNAIDAVVVQVSAPNVAGVCSLGPHTEFLPALLTSGAKLLGVINHQTPFVDGSVQLPLNRFDAIVEGDFPLPEYDPGGDSDIPQRIAQHIANLIPDGATLQCGLGKVPSFLMRGLRNHRNLRIHSGMISDSLLTLLEHNALDPAQPITSIAALGSRSFYRQLNSLPNLNLCGVDKCHSASVLAAIPALYAVNSALEVDLSGQANAEMLNGRYVSGPGGLPDFAAGAAQQGNGLSIVALPSTDPKGAISRIVARFTLGTPATIPQYNVDAVVTEYGIAMLRGVDQRTRARRLLDIAHPHHRDAIANELENNSPK